jgi:hypothetical protein
MFILSAEGVYADPLPLPFSTRIGYRETDGFIEAWIGANPNAA